MKQLRIYFTSRWTDANSPCPWALTDENGNILQSGESPLASMPAANQYHAIIAADRVTCASTKSPTRSRRRWEKALPFVAEEFSLTDPEQNHVAPGIHQTDGTCPLVLIDKEWLTNIISACRSANRTLSSATPETLLPQLQPNSWVLVWDGHDGFLRTSETSGLALDKAEEHSPPVALRLSLETAHPNKIELRRPHHASSQAMPQWQNLPVPLVEGPPWDWRTVSLNKQTMNLLHGEFAPRIRFEEWLPKLYPPILLLVVVLTLEAVASNIEWWRLAQEKRALSAQMTQTFQKAFGADSVVVNPALQMQRKLAELRHSVGQTDETDFLPLLENSAPAFASLPTNSVRGLHYEDGRLSVDVHLPGARELDELRQRLQNRGFTIRDGEMKRSANGLDIRLGLQRMGAS